MWLNKFLFSVKPRLYEIVLTTLTIVLIIISTLIYLQNKKLANGIEIAKNEIDAGFHILPLDIYRYEDKKQISILPDSSKKSILYFFSTSCIVCEKNKKYWYYLEKRLSKYYSTYTIAVNWRHLDSFINDMPKSITPYYLKNNLPYRKILRIPTLLIVENDYVIEKYIGLLDVEKIQNNLISRSSIHK